MLDEIIIGIGGRIRLNPLQAFEEVAGVNSGEYARPLVCPKPHPRERVAADAASQQLLLTQMV